MDLIKYLAAFWFCQFKETDRATLPFVSKSIEKIEDQILKRSLTDNPVITITYDGKEVTRSGKTYVSIENLKLTFTTSRIHFDFQNLYNGDKLLGDSTNKFLNENWNDIFKEIKVNIFDAFGLIAENVVRNVFNKVPYQELFVN